MWSFSHQIKILRGYSSPIETTSHLLIAEPSATHPCHAVSVVLHFKVQKQEAAINLNSEIFISSNKHKQIIFTPTKYARHMEAEKWAHFL
jgi:flagellar assembly factor FliW